LRLIVAIGLVIILGACDPYVAVKGIEAAAKVGGPKEGLHRDEENIRTFAS